MDNEIIHPFKKLNTEYTTIELEVFKFNEVKETSNGKISYVMKNKEHMKRLFTIDYKQPRNTLVLLSDPVKTYDRFNRYTYDIKDLVGYVTKFTITTDGKLGYRDLPIYTVRADIDIDASMLKHRGLDIKNLDVILHGTAKNYVCESKVTARRLQDIIAWHLVIK